MFLCLDNGLILGKPARKLLGLYAQSDFQAITRDPKSKQSHSFPKPSIVSLLNFDLTQNCRENGPRLLSYTMVCGDLSRWVRLLSQHLVAVAHPVHEIRAVNSAAHDS